MLTDALPVEMATVLPPLSVVDVDEDEGPELAGVGSGAREGPLEVLLEEPLDALLEGPPDADAEAEADAMAVELFRQA